MNDTTFSLRVGCVILAAGSGSRFGCNKLLAEFRGRPLAEWAMEAVPPVLLRDTVLVTQYDAVAALAAARGIPCVRNDAPELGISRSVALGAAALADRCDGLLFLVADQPLLRRETVARLAQVWRAACTAENRTTDHGQFPAPPIAVLSAAGRRGNPCLFPRDLFPALMGLTGDRGGSQIIRRCPDRILSVEAEVWELADVDTAQGLKELQNQTQ